MPELISVMARCSGVASVSSTMPVNAPSASLMIRP
jgi:hypothetical protein